MKNLVGIVMVAMLGVLLVFGAAQAEEPVLGISLPTPDHGWVGAVVANAEAAAKELGVKYKIVTAPDVNKQSNDIDDLIAQNVDAIVMLPVDGTPLTPAAKRVMEADIPLVVFDREIASEDYTTTLKGDNKGIGVNGAKYLIEKLGGKGKVFMLSGIPCSVTTLRDSGFKETIEGTDIEVVGLQDGGFQREKGYQVMQNALTAYPEIDAVFAIDDEMALGALKAIKEAGRTDIKYLTAAGGAKDFYKAIKEEDEIELATFLYSPLMVKDAVKVAVDIMNGKDAENMIVIPADRVDRSNVDEYYDEDSNY